MRALDIAIEDQSFAELDAASRAAGMVPAEFVPRAAAVRLHKARDAAKRDEASDAAARRDRSLHDIVKNRSRPV